MASLLIDQNPSLSSKKNLIKKIFAPLHQGELSKGLRGFKNKSFLTYLILASLLIISTGIGYTLYRQAINRAKTNLAYSTASSPVYANRILSFQGRLTDSSGNPITAETGILFELYNTPDVGTGTTLYTSASGNSQTVTFDNEENGIFSVTIGQSHGTTIPASVFTENSAVYLQITAGGETMSPRQPIATVAYAINAETLQGLPPSASGLKDTVLVIDGSGNLNLGESNPAIIASSTAPNSIFRIEGQAVLIKATDTYGGNIEINPDANGIIKLTTEGSGSTAINGFIDATNANLSTGNLYSATIGNNNRGYNFLNFSNFDSGIGNTQLSTRFSVDASGNTFIGGTLNPTNISIGNTILTSSAAELNYLDGTLVTAGSLIYGNGSNLSNTDVGTSGQILMSNASGAPVWINASSTGIGTTYGATNGLSLISGNFGLGGTLTQNTSIGNSSFSLSFLGLGNTQGLFLASSGNVGIGTTNPTEKFVVSVPTYGDKSFSVYDGYYNYNIGSGSNTTGGYRLSIYKSANEAYFNNAGTNYGGFHFLSDGNDRLTIKSAGFIGIGITNPLYSLQVGGSGTALIGTKLGVGATGSAAFNVSTDASIGTTLTTGTLLVNNTAIGGSNIVAFSSGTSGLVGYLDTTSWDKNASNDYASWNLQANGAGTTAILSGNTVNFVNGVGISLSQTGSSITINNTGIGTTYAATNGLTLTSGNFGLGGTLTQNTQIGTSSFSLSFLGLGNTQGLYLASSGNVGIGTTNPLYTLDVSGKIALDGTQALYIPTNFYGNLIVGDGGTHLTHTTDLEGWYNTFVGIGVGMSNTTGYYNSAIGSYALYNNTTGNSNTANGASSLFSNTTGSYNTAFGAIALYNNTEGSYNTAIGHIALTNNTTGSDNFGLGDQALYNNTTGNYNIAIGSLAQNNTTDGSENISIGRASLYGNTTGTNNIALGLISGRYLADGSTANTTADYSMYLGIRSRSLASNSQNEIVIGSYAIGNGSNSVTIGSTAVTKTILQGNIGLGTTNPTYKLEIGGTGSAYVGGNLTVGSIGATTDNNQVLTSTGGLIQYLDTSSWDKTSSDDFQNWVLASGSTSAIIGTGNTVTFVEGVGISLVQTGNTITITNTGLGTTYTASAGITLVANDFRLNLGSSNVFTALQSFTGGIGVSGNTNLTNNLTIGGTFVSVGSTNLVTNLNADLLDGNHATAFVGVGATGNFITTITGGVGISLFGSGIGRTVNIASPTCTGTDKLQWNGSAFICSADVGATYSASVGITLVGNDIRLHLGYAPTWTGLHTFSSGATISNLSVGGTFVSVGSTNTVTNLSSDYLDGYNSTYFVNIGQTGNFLTTLNLQAGTSMTITGTGVGTTISHSDTSTQASSDNSNGVVIQDISLDGLGHLTGLATVDLDSRYLQIGNTGSLPYVNNATNGTLTRSGTGPFTLALNLGATNTWTGLQTFNLGATNASFAVGSTVMITSLNADLLDGLHSSSFMQVGSTGFLTTATNGLMAIGSTAVGLGGTLTQNTSIGNSSFSLSFLGLGNTQGLFLASSGNVGIGTTSPTQKFDVAGKIALNGTQALYIPTNFSETLIVGDGGTHLTHSTDAEGWYNTFVGIGVGYSNTTGYMNTGLGDWALYSNKTGNNNTSIGAATLWQSTGSENTAIGTASLYSNTTGGANSAFGTYSMGSNTEGTDNVAMGYFSLFGNTTGTRNSAIGVYTLGSNVDGSYNSALGSDAGVYLSTGSTITSPDYGLYLGYNTRSLVNNAQNEVVIGANAVGNGSNSVMIGSTTVTKTTINGNLGLGTTNPTSKLHVVGNGYFSTSLSIGTSLNVVGNTSIGGTLAVTGRSTFAQNVFVNAGGIGVTGVSVFSTGATIASLSVSSIGSTTDNNQVLTSTGGLIQYLDTSAWDKNASNDFQNWVLSSSNVNTTIGTGNTVTFVNGVGISLSQTGSSITINNTGTGTTYAAGNGLTLSSGTFKLGGELTEATRLYIGSTEVLYLSATGDVGIGITSPGAKLQINPDITTKIGLLVKGFPSQSANLQEWQRSDGTVLALLDKNGSFVSYSSILSYHFYAPNETSHMYFDSAGGIRFTTGPWNDQVNRLSIGASGNVGIGTTNPLYTLHVAGTGVALIGTKLGVGATSVSAFNVSTDASIGTTLTTGSLIVNNTAIGGSNIVAFSSGTSGLVGYLDTTAWDKNASNDYASWNLQTNSAGTTAIGTGTTVNFVNGVGISLSQTGSSITINSTGTGTTYAATNGLTLTSGNFGLGGTLTQNTSIGNSSFSLSFLGLGNTQGLFLASSGNVGIGTTSPTQKLDVSGKIALNGTQALYIPTNFTETLIVGDGGTHLTHTTDAEGWYNTFVGIGVGYSNTTGYDNTGVGDWALYSNKTGNDNTAIGAGALVANTGSQNTALGSLSLYSNTSGNQNTANGTYSLFSNTTGNLNTSVGYYSLVLNTTGYDNTAVGAATLSENTTGHTNSAVGNGALYYNETGSYNVVLGTEALSRNQTGNYNTAIGYNAGRFTSAGASNATSDYSFYLGADARSLADNDQNEIVIGNYAIGNGSNTISIGSTANVKTIMFGNMGIGTTNPLYTLHVGGSGTALIGTKLGVGATSTSAFNVSTDANIGTTLTTGSLLVNNTAIGGSNIIAFSSGTSGLVGYLDTTAWDKNASNDYASWMLQANSAGTTAIGTGTTVNFVNGVGISLSQTGSSITINSTGTGTTYAATNGLTLTSGNFGLGGTLTQNTSIGNSSFSLSFLGLGNTQGLFLASSGNVGIGTTNPTAKLVVVGDGSSGSPDLTLLNNDGSINFEIRTSLTELNNILIGNNSGKSITSGQRNIAIGKYSLYTNQTGSGNFAIGQEALYYNTASDNSAIGYMTLHENINGTNNAAQGQVAMYSNTSGSNNSGFGHSVLKANTSGSYNSAFGVDAGRYLGDGSTGNTTPDYGLYLGYSSRSLVDNSQNEIVIGSYAIGNGSNSVSIGSTAVTKTILQGNLGLGTTNPVQKLSVIGNGSFSTSLTVGTTLTTPTLVVNSTAAVGGSNVAAFSTGTSGLVGYLSTAGWDKSTADDYASWMLQANSAGTTAIGTGTTVNFVNGVGISLSQTGSSITINSTAGTYTASTGITLVTNDFRLNLGYNPTWTALHTFSGGATISSLSVTNNASIGATLTTPTLLVNNTAIGGSNVAAFSTGTSGLVGYLDTTAWDKLASDDLTTSSNLLMVKGDSGTAENIAVGNTISFVGGAGLGSTVSATDTITFNIGASAGINVAADTIGVNAGAGLTFSGTQLILNLGSTNVWTALQTFTNGIGVSGTAAFTNNVTIGNSLTVTQLTTLTAGFTANATSYVSSLGIGTSLNVVGNASIGGTLAVTGKSVFTAGFDSNGASIITNLTLDGNSGTALAISGTSFTTDITLQNNATIDNDVSGRINFGSGATIPYLSQNGTTFLTSTQLFQAGDGAVGTPAYSFTNDTNSGIYSGGADILNIGTSGLFRLTILANGRIGIGTTTPTAKLTVDGSIKGDNLILTGNNTLIGFAGFIPYFNTSGGLGTGGIQRLTSTGNLTNIGSIQAGQLNISSGGTFSTGITYPTIASGPYSVTSADLNGDGQPDLVSADGGTENAITVFINNGDGTFATGTTYPTIATTPFSVTSADLNSDGYSDLITANNGTPDSITVFINNGNGTFGVGTTYPSRGTNPYTVITTDLNGDGQVDLVTNNYGSNNINVFTNNGDGTFNAGTTYPTIAAGPYSVTSGDLNGDDNPDLITANYTANNITVFNNNGDGTFAAGITYPTIATNPTSITSRDLDRDGYPDLITANNGTPDSITIFNNNGDGTLGVGTTYLTKGANPYSVTSADLNGDGQPDLATANGTGNNITVFTNNNDGTFSTGTTYPTIGRGPRSVIPVDLNSDGLSDLVSANNTDNNITVFFNNPTTTLYTASSGYVGIGTTNPTAKLSIVGNDGLLASFDTINAGTTEQAFIDFNGARAQVGYDGKRARAFLAGTSGKGLELLVNGGVGGTNYTAALNINTNGFVGIGTTSPKYLLEVIGANTSGVAYIKNTTSTTMPTLTINTSSTNTGTTGAEFIRFVNAAGNSIGRIRQAGSTLAITIGTSAAGDFAEYVRGDEPTEETDLIAFHGDKFGKAREGETIAGTHSNFATFVGNEGLASEPNSFPLALIGIVEVKVSSDHGSINPGDPLAISNIPGVAAKATKAGLIVGRAMESYSNNDPNVIGKIRIIVNTIYYDPDIQLTATGQININYNVSPEVLASLGYDGTKNEIESATYSLTDSLGATVTRISQFSEIATAKIKAGLISAKNIIADNIVTKKLISQKIETDNIISPLGNIDHLTTTDIQTSQITTDNLIAQNIQVTEMVVEDIIAENIISENLETEKLTSDQLTSREATVSTLYADQIISKDGSFGDLMAAKISSLRDELKSIVAANTEESTPSAILSSSKDWSITVATDSATIKGNLSLTDSLIIGAQLMVNGDSQFKNAFVSGDFTAGEIALSGNSISTLNTALYIQPTNTGSVHIMGETLVIAESGQVNITGDLTITGSLFGNLIQAAEIETQKLTAAEINSNRINIATDSASLIIASESEENVATNSAQLTSNATAGTATLPIGKTEIIINSDKLTPNSMVYLTPMGSTNNQVIYVKDKSESNFTISLDNSLDHDINVNWWIIN